MERQYAVLRDMNRAFTGEPMRLGRGPLGIAALGAAARPLRAVAPPEPRVEVHSLRLRDVKSLAAEPDVVSIAQAMPLALIRPVDVDAKAVGTAWGVQKVGATASTFTGAGVRVAILDTGIDATHPAFAGVNIVQEDFSGSGLGDAVGHGTHCAGTILGRDVGGTRIGIARGVSDLLIGKVLDNSGGGSSEMLFAGIQWALAHQAHVISMSLGFDFPGLVDDLHTSQGVPIAAATSIALEAYRGNLHMFDALMGMVRASLGFGAGTVVVAASGNESQRPTYEVAASLPSAAEGVVSVAALGRKGTKVEVTFFSNTLAQISAPGLDILSAKAGGGLTTMSGTSMACPHVAGVTALWWESVMASPVPANAQVVTNKLLATARTTGFVAGVDIADRGVGIVAAP